MLHRDHELVVFEASDRAGGHANGASPNGLFATRGILFAPSFHRMIADLIRFNRGARRLLASEEAPLLGDHLNRLQSLRAEREFCVTLNRTEAIDPEQIISKTQYAQPLYTPAGVAAQARHQEISGRNRTHYCGAYWGWGFHEDGLRSARRVVGELTLQRAEPVRI